MISIGIDSGSTMTKAVAFDGKNVIEKIMLPTSFSPAHSAGDVLEKLQYHLLNNHGLEKKDTNCIVSTGYGRKLCKSADKQVTEITCHGRGAFFLKPDIDLVIDIGGQDCKAIRIEEGRVTDFLMNDKCAAGTGRFIEMMLTRLEQSFDNIDTFTKGHKPVSIGSMCTVFAESEIISLLSGNVDSGDIALGVIHSISRRTASFAGKLGDIKGNIFFTGGLANCMVFRNTLEEYIKSPVIVHELSQYAGAIGAALIGQEEEK